MNRKEKATELFSQGYNCAQAVALAFADKVDIDLDALKRASAPFGGGMGRLREVCGAVSGMFMIIGLAKAGDMLVKENKLALYKLEQEAAAKFRERAGSIVCRELLEMRPHGDVPNREKIGCKDLVALGVEIVEEMKIFE